MPERERRRQASEVARREPRVLAQRRGPGRGGEGERGHRRQVPQRAGHAGWQQRKGSEQPGSSGSVLEGDQAVRGGIQRQPRPEPLRSERV